jgi:Domain of unknown function (DUF4260)
MRTTAMTRLPPGRRRVFRRVGWFVAGVGFVAFAIFEVAKHDLGPAPILIFLLLPDLTFIAGAGQAHAPRQLPPRAVPFYNLAHQPLVPVALIAVASIVPLSVFWFVAGLAWLAHIAIDLALGYGQRTPEGWQRG